VEFIKFFYEGGTKYEYFEDYFSSLVTVMRDKYPAKHLL